MNLVNTRPQGQPHMSMGRPGVLRVLTHDERRQSERDWDARVDAAKKTLVEGSAIQPA